MNALTLKFLIFQKKDQMMEATCELIKSWKDRGIVIKFVRMYNAGEKSCLSREQEWSVGLPGGVYPKELTTA